MKNLRLQNVVSKTKEVATWIGSRHFGTSSSKTSTLLVRDDQTKQFTMVLLNKGQKVPNMFRQLRQYIRNLIRIVNMYRQYLPVNTTFLYEIILPLDVFGSLMMFRIVNDIASAPLLSMNNGVGSLRKNPSSSRRDRAHKISFVSKQAA